MKLANNAAILPISRPDGSILNLVLTWDDKHLVLIDAAIPGKIEEIAQAISDNGFSLEQLTHLILTHQDWDHIGCVSELQEKVPNLKVLAHTEESPYLDGRTIPIKLAGRLEQYDTLPKEQQAITDWWKELYENPRVTITDELRDGQVLPICGGIEIVHVPGHTPGHIALYLRKSRIIVCGDAANISGGQVAGSNPIYTQNMEQAAESLEKIKSYDLAGLTTYHTGFLPFK